MRAAERDTSDRHYARLRDGRPESITSSAIHLDVIRDLKRINSHLTSVGYPILEDAGELAESRLLAREAESQDTPQARPGLPGAAPSPG